MTRASGVLTIVRVKVERLGKPRSDGLWVAVDSVRSPGNLGTLIRTASGIGAHGVILTSPHNDPYKQSVIRASVGAVFSVPLFSANGSTLRGWADLYGVALIGATPGATRHVHTYEFPPKLVLWIGSERLGLSDAQIKLCDETLRIPMAPGTDSLNLAVSGSVLMYSASIVRSQIDRGVIG